ncbi:MAG: hypothetical protein AAB434_01015 [Planctomycetota bacterium]
MNTRAHIASGILCASLAAAVGLAAGMPAGVLLMPILAALAVPFAASSPKGHLGFSAALGLAVGGAVWGALAGLGSGKSLTLLLVLGSFSLLVAAACSPARARRASPGVVLLSGAIPGFLLLGTVFYVDPLVQACEGHPDLSRAVITTAVAANPMLVLSQHVGDEDLLHTALYGRSTIGDRFFQYPPAWQPAIAFGVVAAALLGASRLMARPEV